MRRKVQKNGLTPTDFGNTSSIQVNDFSVTVSLLPVALLDFFKANLTLFLWHGEEEPKTR